MTKKPWLLIFEEDEELRFAQSVSDIYGDIVKVWRIRRDVRGRLADFVWLLAFFAAGVLLGALCL